jgi:hypothetical protein
MITGGAGNGQSPDTQEHFRSDRNAEGVQDKDWRCVAQMSVWVKSCPRAPEMLLPPSPQQRTSRIRIATSEKCQQEGRGREALVGPSQGGLGHDLERLRERDSGANSERLAHAFRRHFRTERQRGAGLHRGSAAEERD